MYSALVVNCVWNAFLSSTAIALNIITIQALRKASSFPKTLQTLLLSLAVSDLGVGLLVQPLFIADLVLKTAERITNNCRICTLSLEIGQVLFASASFVGVVALTVDRFLAIHLHLRYQELVTHKRVVAAVISIWVFSALVSLLESIQIKSEVIFIILISTETVCLHYYRTALLQDIRSRTTLQKSDSRPASAANSTEWRIDGKFLKTDKSYGHTTDFYVGKPFLPRANSSKICLGKFISGFVLPR